MDWFHQCKIRSGENCVHDDDKNYTQYPSQMQTTSLEGAAGMEIAGLL